MKNENVVVLHKTGPIWEVKTPRQLKGFIHTWMFDSERMLLLKEMPLVDGTLVTMLPGEFLSYMNPYGMLVPIMRT